MTALARFVKGEIEISHFYLRHAACVILSERAERARAKDLLEDAQRMRAKGVVPEGMSVAPEGKQVLSACGAQDDSARSVLKERNKNIPFLPETRGVCNPERARGTRASEGPAGTAGGGAQRYINHRRV